MNRLGTTYTLCLYVPLRFVYTGTRFRYKSLDIVLLRFSLAIKTSVSRVWFKFEIRHLCVYCGNDTFCGRHANTDRAGPKPYSILL